MCRPFDHVLRRGAALCLLLSLATQAGAYAPAATAMRIKFAPQASASAAPESALAQLREFAVLGDTDASGELATRLLDRFERTGDRRHLHEAMQWIARDWEHERVVRADLADRVLSRHCARPALQRHWLCTGGD
ncbi:hypothetical protein [Ramlibacter montanisoli]|uniref:Lytic transglycosylase domain-containing protein n=1 Tax=Ramlibacter montanisoli TaxID=2732512 RepID=A0A849KDF8_9BURK|nr:hypothetical protein [Ramlibacter montanisoli]NNU42283.1 hypothetical protein [Ramlibacter montanisoli]